VRGEDLKMFAKNEHTLTIQYKNYIISIVYSNSKEFEMRRFTVPRTAHCSEGCMP